MKIISLGREYMRKFTRKEKNLNELSLGNPCGGWPKLFEY